jgi:hypothetical protein
MTRLLSKPRNWPLFFGIAAALFMIVLVLNLGTAIRNPDFLIMSEARGDSAPWLIRARLQVAGLLGGRADTKMIGYGDQSSLRIASEHENLMFLKEAVRLSSPEHVHEVFEVACVEGRAGVVRTLRETRPELECPSRE